MQLCVKVIPLGTDLITYLSSIAPHVIVSTGFSGCLTEFISTKVFPAGAPD